MKIKTSELTGAALDWAVALIELPNYKDEERLAFVEEEDGDEFRFSPSTDWAQGGPITDRMKGFQFKHWPDSNPESCCEAHMHNGDGDWIAFGPTLLIAAMRCRVASKLGDEVEVPDEIA